MDFEGMVSLASAEDVQVHEQDNSTVEERLPIADGTVQQAANEPSPSTVETEEIAKELLAVVCKNGGMIDVRDAFGSLSEVGTQFVNSHGIYPLLQSSLSDVLKLEVQQPGNQATLRVKVDAEICRAYTNTECLLANECPRLHICPRFVKGTCASEGDDNENCYLSHNFYNEHEQRILRNLKLDTLHEGSLLPLFRNIIRGLSDGIIESTEVCSYYNTVQGCPTGISCLGLHLCAAFSNGECEHRADTCTRSHDVLVEKTRLAKRVEQQIVASRILNFQNFLSYARRAAVTQASPPTINEICGFHLRGNCRYGPQCKRYWSKLPYIWQIAVTFPDESEKLVHFPSMYSQLIEWDYCDVNEDTSLDINLCGGEDSLLRVCFDEMVAKTKTGNHSVNIRRLSTISWVKAAPGNSFGTKWTWYWKNDQDQWVPYDGADFPVSSIVQNSNEILEDHFQAGAELFTLSLNGQTYNIDLKNYQQTNTVTGKSRKIRRRPTSFIGTKDIQPSILRLSANRRRQCQTQQLQPRAPSIPASPPAHNVTLPQGWTAMQPDQDVAMVTLQPGSAQYNHAQTEFKKTLSNKTIHKIERVQNLDLWESYSRKLSKLSRKLGRQVEVRELFHGTAENNVKAICQQGFDWRLSGAHGTACGKGSYFAVRASYSDGFSTPSSTTRHKMMFLNKVIVGLYTIGNGNTVRPPPRDPSKPYELYHSCVDSTTNPVMFVVFENDQAYPEYLISYS